MMNEDGYYEVDGRFISFNSIDLEAHERIVKIMRKAAIKELQEQENNKEHDKE
ncbi:MAG: hypothetical protein WC810_22675 [Janthinobacterium sp.]